jgi:hypothetical protein
VTALFNTPLEEEIEYGQYGDDTLRTDFQVGPFIYAINFSPENDHGSTVNVEFELADIDASDEELIRMMSKFKRSVSKEKGEDTQEPEQPMSLQEAKTLERQILNQHSHAEIEITGPYVIKIFSTVLNIIRDYRKKYRTNCIVFSAASEDRSRVYQRMMKSTFPGAGIRVRPSPWGAGTEIRVCFI